MRGHSTGTVIIENKQTAEFGNLDDGSDLRLYNSQLSYIETRGRLNWRKLFSEKDIWPALTLLVLVLVMGKKGLTHARVMTNFDQNQICIL